MRIFQNIGFFPAYKKRLDALAGESPSFESKLSTLIEDRYIAGHLLKPISDGDANAFLTIGEDPQLQRAWAHSRGMPAATELTDILLAQVEEHRAEVFYNMSPIVFGSPLAKRLPGCVKASVCWRAAPLAGANLSAYDLVVCNFPSIIEQWRRLGYRAAYFAPAHDPGMDPFAHTVDRPIDLTFFGGYSRHHIRRTRVLERVAELSDEWRVAYYLDRSRLTRFADSPVGVFPKLRDYRRPLAIRRVSQPPVFGKAMLETISMSKIVLNGAIDMAGEDRGNMRCFEALGCGALLLSDEGRYPEGFEPQQNMCTYSSPDDAVAVVEKILRNWPEYERIAQKGNRMVKVMYSKERQWVLFQQLVAAI